MQNGHPDEPLEAYQSQLEICGQTWNIFKKGAGTPIVFLHNGGGTLWNWAHQLQYFSDSFQVIAPDLPGFGRSYRPNAPLTLDFYVKGLGELFKVLDSPNPILVGNCIGASIALEFALRYPAKVKALTVFNVCGGMPMLSPHLRFWAGWSFRSMVDFASRPMMQRLSAPLLYADRIPDLHPALERFVRQQRSDRSLQPSLYWLLQGLDTFNKFSQPGQRPNHFPPVLLAWGMQNRTLPIQWADSLAEWLRPDHLWRIEKAGHMPMYEQPEQVNEVLEDFFRSCV